MNVEAPVNAPVRLIGSATHHDEMGELAEYSRQALACQGDVSAALRLARHLGRHAPLPGSGSTAQLWNVLATVAAADVTVARTVEPHLDALAILSQAGEIDLSPIGVTADSAWGVFAAEAPAASLRAFRSADGWHLTGQKAWCSLAGTLSHALVTADTGDSTRRLFAVSLKQPGVLVNDDGWHASGLRAIPSGSVDFDGVAATPVGDDDWYLQRSGFAWGGIGVAACWWGAAVGIARRVSTAAEERAPDQIALMHIGSLDIDLYMANVALAAAAHSVDHPDVIDMPAEILAHRTRSTVALVAERVIERVGHALGPAPLVREPEHSRRVADLQLYLRQHHAERDFASLGRILATQESEAW